MKFYFINMNYEFVNFNREDDSLIKCQSCDELYPQNDSVYCSMCQLLLKGCNYYRCY